MKKLFFISILLLAGKLTLGQTNYKIVYERTVNIHANLPEDKKYLKTVIPEKSVQKLVCYCNKEMAILKELDSKPNNNDVTINVKAMAGLYFFEFAKKIVRHYVNYDNFNYYVEELLINLKLKPKKDTKKILGYLCKKVIQNEGKENEMFIWYSTDIPAYASPIPQIYIQGVILAIESEKIQYLAKSVDKDKTPIKVNKPDALKISRDQLKDLRNEQIDKQKGKRVTIEM